MIRRGVIASQKQAAPGPDGTYTLSDWWSQVFVYDSGTEGLEWYPTNTKPAMANVDLGPLSEQPTGADYGTLGAFTDTIMALAESVMEVPPEGADVGVTNTTTGEILWYKWYFRPCFVAYDWDFNFLGSYDNLADCMLAAPPRIAVAVGTLVAQPGCTLSNPYIIVDGQPAPPPEAGVVHPTMMFLDETGQNPLKVFQVPRAELRLDGYVPPPSCLFPLSATQQTIDTYFSGQGQLATITDDYSQSFSAPISVVASDTTYYATTVDGPTTRLPTADKTSAIEVAITLPEHPDGAGTQDIAFVAQTVLANTSIEDLVATISAIRYEDGAASLVVSIPGESLQTFPLTGTAWVLGIVIADGAGTFDLYLDGTDMELTGASIAVEPWLYFGLGVRAANTLESGQITVGFRTAEEQFTHAYPNAATICELPPPPLDLSDQIETANLGSVSSIEVILQNSAITVPTQEDNLDTADLGTVSSVEVVLQETLIIVPSQEDNLDTADLGTVSSIEVILTQEIE
ncbi:hypothetical protein BN2364_4065 [Alloalcanivorax xenomutans]|uniref:hypothetical protein n=1 Tax=Alloalcanivorax xenomutans TaxID=1094342 RepID=UPI0006D5C74F|nr:hypothetical protein [Alloalcanivorax xenomutans]CUR48506.1 hypothetical protein BN2364_4065 [Alloalcanivorax xenomutans]